VAASCGPATADRFRGTIRTARFGKSFKGSGAAGITSLFGGDDDDNAPQGPNQRVSQKDFNDALGSLFNLPPMGGQSGNLGINDQTQQGATAIANYLGTLHNIGDPTKGRVPGTGSSATPVITSDDLKAQARSFGQQLMKNWMQYELGQHDQTPGGSVHGSAHPTWWSDDTDPKKVDPNKKDASAVATQGLTRQDLISGVEDPEQAAQEEAEREAKEAAHNKALGVTTGFVGGMALGAFILVASSSKLTLATGLFVIGMGVLGGYVAAHHMPGPDDGGGGPRSNRYMPDPETGSGGGPRAYAAMPDPETGTGGGPRGIDYFPDPETGSGAGPRANVLRSGKS
jgi:hypothetical protein